jgi:hypothetical protein
MSPEQIVGDPIDFRTDQFAFGILLYELLVGEKPFKADTASSLLEKIRTQGYIDVRSAKSGVPRALAKVVRRCLKKEPKKRFDSTASAASRRVGAQRVASARGALRDQPQGRCLHADARAVRSAPERSRDRSPSEAPDDGGRIALGVAARRARAAAEHEASAPSPDDPLARPRGARVASPGSPASTETGTGTCFVADERLLVTPVGSATPRRRARPRASPSGPHAGALSARVPGPDAVARPFAHADRHALSHAERDAETEVRRRLPSRPRHRRQPSPTPSHPRRASKTPTPGSRARRRPTAPKPSPKPTAEPPPTKTPPKVTRGRLALLHRRGAVGLCRQFAPLCCRLCGRGRSTRGITL